MNTKQKVVTALRQVKTANKRIRDEFAKMDNSLIEEFLGEQYSPQLHEQVKTYGDGQRLCSYPRSMRVLETVDAVVIIAMSFPVLGNDSIFDRTTSLHEIQYWRTIKPIRPVIDSQRLHFMVWQQTVGVHGGSRQHALSNYGLLTSRNRRLESLLDSERKSGIRFVIELERWLGERKKDFVVITNSIQTNFDEPILSLIHSPSVKHIRTGLRSRNYKIMEQIGSALMKDD